MRSIRVGIARFAFGAKNDDRKRRANLGDARRAPAPAGSRRVNRTGGIALVIGLVAVVLMAFRVSWNALSDVARAISADSTAALLYPIVVDGLMALALTATLVLTGADRKFALRVLATYTIASLLLNYVHGLVPALHTDSIQWGRLTDLDYANWALVLLATSLPVGSIYFGSELVAKVLHHKPEESADSSEMASGQSAGEPTSQSTPDQPASIPEQLPESTPAKVTEAPMTELAEESESSPVTRPPRSVTAAETTGAATRRATVRGPAPAKSTTGPTGISAELLSRARLLTADWPDGQLTAVRLRTELRIGQKPSRLLRDQLQADHTGQVQPVTDNAFEAGSLDEAASPTRTV
ncbi:DUF2637 domain-containing protein [Streptomyces sp. AM 4-1-1]|uniref:DUF2637 domain-containing protein n=1 Tax=Streptomyces sp. AM 4-1-1 TaxID=3028710 RepID=UPI0023BA2D03|nr:DUF2637 domain-containing protein [Streptomyces sp. AM 4-1-1]WEH34808.1 DUF2637 domain-containing protein [Streptomyces sp. AM 4-1-1]